MTLWQIFVAERARLVCAATIAPDEHRNTEEGGPADDQTQLSGQLLPSLAIVRNGDGGGDVGLACLQHVKKVELMQNGLMKENSAPGDER